MTSKDRTSVRRFDTYQDEFEVAFSAFLEIRREKAADVSATVSDILKQVESRGDEALLAYTEKFDSLKLDLTALKVSLEDIDAGYAACTEKTLAALKLAADRITAYHCRQIPEDEYFTDETGVEFGSRWTPLDSVGLYVPGGAASYPSSVLMNALPARVAGVKRLVMVTPTPKGVLNPLVLAAAKIAGVNEIYRIGGAQAIGALAFGTRTIAPVDKIVGPGNAYVAEAKRQVFGHVGIDMIAGPSEILVVADRENDPAWIAADLMSQAEHDPSSQSVLITDDEDFADRVSKAVQGLLTTLPRAAIAAKSWYVHGAIITVRNISEAPFLINRIAPEHVEIATYNPEEISVHITHAGAIFHGRTTPEAIGDYVAGTNHVLPTSRSARFSSGLSVLDFLKRTSLVSCNGEALSKIGPAAITLARAEGLDAHALSVSIRLNR